jgi:hypothetical protein
MLTILLTAATLAASVAQEPFKNLRVLQDVSGPEVRGSMIAIAGSLGVACDHCHTERFDEDKKPAKETARLMIEMTRGLNQASFSDRPAVSCFTCHRGELRPPNGPIAHPTAGARPADSLPSAEQVLERYLGALGGKAAVDRVTSMRLCGKASRTIGGRPVFSAAIEIERKAPDKWRSTYDPPKGIVQAHDGRVAWRSSGGHPGEMESADANMARREASFWRNARIAEQFSKLVVAGKESVGEHECVVLAGTPVDHRLFDLEYDTEWLYFDSTSWLLVRRALELPTPLGPVASSEEFDDYRLVRDVRVPFTHRFSLFAMTQSEELTGVDLDVVLDDARFAMPAKER